MKSFKIFPLPLFLLVPALVFAQVQTGPIQTSEFRTLEDIAPETLYRCKEARFQTFQWMGALVVDHGWTPAAQNNKAAWEVCDLHHPENNPGEYQRKSSLVINQATRNIYNFCLCIEWEPIQVVSVESIKKYLNEVNKKLKTQSDALKNQGNHLIELQKIISNQNNTTKTKSF